MHRCNDLSAVSQFVAPCKGSIASCIGISSRRRKDAPVRIKKLVQVAPPARKNVPVSADPSKHESVALTLMVKECARKNKELRIIYWLTDASY